MMMMMMTMCCRLWVHVWELTGREPGLGARHQADGGDVQGDGRHNGCCPLPVVHGALCAGLPGRQVSGLVLGLHILLWRLCFSWLSLAVGPFFVLKETVTLHYGSWCVLRTERGRKGTGEAAEALTQKKWECPWSHLIQDDVWQWDAI